MNAIVMNGYSTRLLLMSCSDRKRRDAGLLRAIERYNGPAFYVVRRYLREHESSGLLVYILSAEFGVISANEPIPHYDRPMTADRAIELCEEATETLNAIIRQAHCKELFVCASAMYKKAIAPSKLGPLVHVRYAAAGQGHKLRSLHCWLRESENGNV